MKTKSKPVKTKRSASKYSTQRQLDEQHSRFMRALKAQLVTETDGTAVWRIPVDEIDAHVYTVVPKNSILTVQAVLRGVARASYSTGQRDAKREILGRISV